MDILIVGKELIKKGFVEHEDKTPQFVGYVGENMVVYLDSAFNKITCSSRYGSSHVQFKVSDTSEALTIVRTIV
jgi:hypothetical protein